MFQLQDYFVLDEKRATSMLAHAAGTLISYYIIFLIFKALFRFFFGRMVDYVFYNNYGIFPFWHPENWLFDKTSERFERFSNPEAVWSASRERYIPGVDEIEERTRGNRGLVSYLTRGAMEPGQYAFRWTQRAASAADSKKSK